MTTAERISEDLVNACDGPVTLDTIIIRSVEMIKTSTLAPQDMAQGMYLAITYLRNQGGYIPSNEFANARAL